MRGIASGFSFDKYTRQARLKPSLLVVLPVFVTVDVGVLAFTDLFENCASISHGTLSFSLDGMRFLPQLPRGAGDTVREAQAKSPRLGFPRGRTQRGRVTIHGQITELLNWDSLRTGLWQPGRHSGGDPPRSPPSLGKPR